MDRRYDVATFLRRTGLARDFNLTTDVIVGFPRKTSRRFGNTLRWSPKPDHEDSRLSLLAAPAREPRRGHGQPTGEEGACGAAAGRSRERPSSRTGGASSARDDVVLVDRPGRGYGDD